MSEYRAPSNRNAWAASSESAPTDAKDHEPSRFCASEAPLFRSSSRRRQPEEAAATHRERAHVAKSHQDFRVRRIKYPRLNVIVMHSLTILGPPHGCTVLYLGPPIARLR